MLRLSNELLTVSSEQGFAMWFGVGNAVRGWCLIAAHESPEGIPLLRRGIAEVMATGSSCTAFAYDDGRWVPNGGSAGAGT